MRALTEAELAHERQMIAAAQVDAGRFAELYARHFDRVYAFAVSRTRDRADAEDVTAETFARAFRNLPRYEWRGLPFAAWLLQIAANAATDLQKRQPAAAPLDENVAHGDLLPDLAEVEARADLFALVQRLPEDQRSVIAARFGEERGIREIAAALGRSEGAVKQLQYRALKTLRAWVDDDHA